MSATIHRCSDCSHKNLDHSNQDGSRCSMGACPCTDSSLTIQRREPAEQIPTFPGYDATTRTWGRK